MECLKQRPRAFEYGLRADLRPARRARNRLRSLTLALCLFNWVHQGPHRNATVRDVYSPVGIKEDRSVFAGPDSPDDGFWQRIVWGDEAKPPV